MKRPNDDDDNEDNSDREDSKRECLIVRQPIILSDRDREIVIDPDKHVYYINDVPCNLSVSKYLKYIYDPFDSETVLMRQARKLSKSKLFVQSRWNLASYYGSKVHKYIEDYLNREPALPRYNEDYSWIVAKDPLEISQLKTESLEKCYNSVVFDFVDHFQTFFGHLELIASEYMVYGQLKDNLFLSGTIDALFWLDKTKRTVVLVDWKSNRSNIHFAFKQAGGMFCGSEKSRKDQYFCQLHLYKYILEKYYNVQVVYCMLFHLTDGEIAVHTHTKCSDCDCKNSINLI